MNEELILVNEKDEEVGTEDKLKAHQKGTLHRAFSIFVFGNQRQILLQQRATSKYHSGGQWTSACDGHPRPGESVLRAAHRRLKAEMGFDCDLKEIFSYVYEANMGNGLTEHEFNHILVGSFNGELKPNPEEVGDYKWEATTNVLKDLQTRPENYAVWFRIAMEKFPTESLGTKQPERLYHVKDDDSIVGPVDRDEAHTRGLLHRAGMVFVLRPDGTILLARRSASKDTFPDTYDCACAFHVTFGESYEEAAKRELLEETGIHATPEYLGKFSFHDPPEYEMVAIFKCRSNEPVVIDHTELIGAEFYSANGVDRIVSLEHVTPWLKIGWKLVREKIA